MNPRAINSANIIQFGFAAVFNLETRKLLFDIAGYTQFNAGGAAAVVGIFFEVRDPSQVAISEIDTAGAPHIDPSVGSTYEVVLSSGVALFGFYNIRAVIVDADGKSYEVKIPPKQICEPDGWENGSVEGNFEIIADCTIPRIRVKENTAFAYAGRAPYSKLKNGVLYYPHGTIDEIPFVYTPFDQNVVYTGTYTVRNKTIARFDMDDNVFVDVSYKTSLEKKITCQSLVADIMCCIEDVQREMSTYCNTQRGYFAKEKMNKAAVPLVIAYAKERAGLDASEDIEEIRRILGCDCNCGPKLIEPQPVGGGVGGGGNFVFQGECDTTVTPTVVGGTTTVVIRKKNTRVLKADNTDAAFRITRSEDNCNIMYALEFDYDVMAESILNRITDSDELQNILNSLVTSTGATLDLVGLDGKNIIDLTQCDYVLVHLVPTSNIVLVENIVIGGQTFNAPANLSLLNENGIESWLNALAKGVFSVSNTPVTGGAQITVQTDDNVNSIATMQVYNQTLAKRESVRFTGTCASLKAILQAIITYLSTIGTTQIQLKAALKVCSFDAQGNVKETNFGADVLLSNYLTSLSTAFCELTNKVKSISTMSCEQVKTLFVARNTAFDHGKDFFTGTKGEACSRFNSKDLSTILLEAIQNNQELHNKFCQLVSACGLGGGGGVAAPDVTSIIANAGLTNINVAALTWSTLPTENQFVTVKIRTAPVAGSNPVWTTVTNNAIVYPNGNFAAPVNITMLNQGENYEVGVWNNAGGIGKTKIIQTMADTGVSLVNVLNATSNGTLTDLRISGTDFIDAPLADGESASLDLNNLVGTLRPVTLTMGGVNVGTNLYFELRRNLQTVESGYFVYNGDLTDIGKQLNLQANDTLIIRRAQYHLIADEYAGSEGYIMGTCSLSNFRLTRSARAVADAMASNQIIRVQGAWHADNGCGSLFSLDFYPEDSQRDGGALNIECNGQPCSSVWLEIIDIIIPNAE